MDKIERPSPVQIADVLRLVSMLIEAGVLFVPIPVFNNKEQNEMVSILMDKIEQWNEYIEKQEVA